MTQQTMLREVTAVGNKQKILDLLQDKDVDVKATDDKGDTLLHCALNNADISQAELIEILKIFLNGGVDINAKNKLGITALQLAVQRREKDVIDFCLERNADPCLKHKRRNSIAHFTIEEECRKFHTYVNSGNVEEHEKESSNFVDWMVSRGIDFFDWRNRENCSAVYWACDFNLQHVLLTLLKRVTDFSALEKDQTPILCEFLRCYCYENTSPYCKTLKPIESIYYKSRHVFDIVKTILERNKSMSIATLHEALRLSIKNKQKSNVIEVIIENIPSAACHSDTDDSLLKTFIYDFKWSSYSKIDGMKILRSLISKGANVKEEIYGRTIAQKLFCERPNLDMLQLLKESEVDFNSFNKDGDNFLHFVSRYGNAVGMIDLVINKSSNLNAMNLKGEQPLQLAIKQRNFWVAKDLIEHGASINNVYNDGTTPLSIACATGQIQVVEKLIEYGVCLEHEDKNYQLLWRHVLGNSKVIELLSKLGADFNIKDDKGKALIHQVIDGSVIKALIKAGALVDLPDGHGDTALYKTLCHKNYRISTELLKCGASIRDPKVFKHTLDHFYKPYDANYPDFRYLKRHLVKLIAAGLLDIKTYAPNGIETILQMFFKDCQVEVECLKSFLVDDCTSLYKLLHRSPNRRCAYVDNEMLKNLVEDEEIEKKFPNYFMIIMGCYNEAVTRKPLLEKAMCILQKITKIILPDLCIDKILEFLSNLDLLSFVEAGKNV